MQLSPTYTGPGRNALATSSGFILNAVSATQPNLYRLTIDFTVTVLVDTLVDDKFIIAVPYLDKGTTVIPAGTVAGDKLMFHIPSYADTKVAEVAALFPQLKASTNVNLLSALFELVQFPSPL